MDGLSIQIVSVPATKSTRFERRRVTARRGNRRFNYRVPAIWTIEPVQDLVCYHDLDLVDELTQSLTAEFL